MCGIAGLIVPKNGNLEQYSQTFSLATEQLRHRGPDFTGEYQDDFVWLMHTRLSVLDLSKAGNQPMHSHDKRFVITYNGEVYNYKDLEKKLSLKRISSNSDTEVILNTYAKIGVDSFHKFNGMFALSIYDKQNNSILLARDRLGIKPLYYHHSKDFFAFSSEIKPLLTLIDKKRLCQSKGVSEWLYYGNSLGGKTLFQGVKQLPPGSFLRLDLNTFNIKIDQYWSPQKLSNIIHRNKTSSNTLISNTRTLLEQSVKRQLVSDVPIGVLLSGGIDSSAITAFASKHYEGRLKTFSIGFDDPSYPDERPKAKRVAKEFGTDHHELFIEGRDISYIVEELIDHHGTPFFDAANIPLYLMAKEVSGSVKVVLQGDGGDELFGGYRRYSTLKFHRLLHSLAPIGKGIASTLMPQSLLQQKILRYCNIYRQDNLASIMGLLLTSEGYDNTLFSVFDYNYRSQIQSENPLEIYHEMQPLFSGLDVGQQMSMLDLSILLPDVYLEKVDRATMAHGLEVRVPFLDNNLVDFVGNVTGKQKIPYGRKKWLLKQALRGVVPDYVLNAPKTGFNVPFRRWLLGPLNSHFYDHLDKFQRKNPGVLNKTVIDDWFNITKSGKWDHSSRLWKIYNFIIWVNRFKVDLNVNKVDKFLI